MLKKGTLAHELITLPGFWHKVSQADSSGLSIRRHRFGSHRKQYLLEFASEKESRSPVLVYYHGGGWRHGKPEMFRVKAKVFTQLGFRVFMPSYRRIPLYNALHIREDLQLTLQFIADLLKQRNEAERGIVLGGMSAGGHLTALMAVDQANLVYPAFAPEQLKGVMMLAAPVNLDKLPYSVYLWALAGKRGSQRYNNTNPYFLRHQFPDVPTLFFHGTKDGMVPYDSGRSFAEKLLEKMPDKVQFHTIKDGSHLDAVSWVHRNNQLRAKLQGWMEQF